VRGSIKIPLDRRYQPSRLGVGIVGANLEPFWIGGKKEIGFSDWKKGLARKIQ